jgi:hypothetical protein
MRILLDMRAAMEERQCETSGDKTDKNDNRDSDFIEWFNGPKSHEGVKRAKDDNHNQCRMAV